VADKKKEPAAIIPIFYYPDADDELNDLDEKTRMMVLVEVDKLNGKSHQELVALLDGRTEPKVVQLEKSHWQGTLRVIFAWGRGCLWMIGSFVKRNNKEGERHMKRILPRASEVRLKSPGDEFD
jgi:phage-related protein